MPAPGQNGAAVKKSTLSLTILYLGIAVLTVILLVILFGPAWYWQQLPNQQLDIWVIDKTVPIQDYREHRGLFWFLNHAKYTRLTTDQLYDYQRDFYGFFPDTAAEYSVRAIPDTTEFPDLIYLADTYGVYTDDYLQVNQTGQLSPLIYGGLDADEVNRIRQNIGRGNTLIGEFNVVASPTNVQNRTELGKLFRTKWNGWKGRYFKELTRGIEVPLLVIDGYERQSGLTWNFHGEGYVLVSDNDQVEILLTGQDIAASGCQVRFSPAAVKEFGVQSEIPYQYWFEFTAPDPGTETLAEFRLPVTADGQAKLTALGLPGVFPAVIRTINTQYTAYYFAGDFADISKASPLVGYAGLTRIMRFFSGLSRQNSDTFYWNGYLPLLEKILADCTVRHNREPDGRLQPTPTPVPAGRPGDANGQHLVARARGSGFQVQRDGTWKDLFVHGVNLGPAVPGRWFTEFPQDPATYLAWFEQIGAMNANCIRIYTLLPPAFYQALATYEASHPEAPLWLLQEIWPEEAPPGNNYLGAAYQAAYEQEIRHGIDAIHGQARIAVRKGRAYGIYTADVSDYVLGYLVGREMEPEEVVATNQANPGFRFNGQYLSSAFAASATEGWLAMSCDAVVSYETATYASQHPVAIVSWPTLDVTEHDSEWNILGAKSREYNDRVAVDINHIVAGSELTAGLFGAYHIYPNYPDFMNNEPGYAAYRDSQGRLRYGGYLAEFIRRHTRYPALVAEFGLATGMGNAHASPDGYNHGGLTEVAQGEGIVRMLQAIRQEHYAGGLIFEWLDEWAKKTWITEPYMIPYDRHVYWHNIIDPEQNYGLLALEAIPPDQLTTVAAGDGLIRQVALGQDASFLYLDVTLSQPPSLTRQRVYIGLDTYGRTLGDTRFAADLPVSAASGLEFMLDLSGYDAAQLLVIPTYNAAQNRFASRPSHAGIYEPMRWLIGRPRVMKNGEKIAATYQDGSALRYGDWTANSYYHWTISGQTIHCRIPWGRLNFTDPSQSRVLDDARSLTEDPVRDQLRTTLSDGIAVSVLAVDQASRAVLDLVESASPYVWPNWTDLPYQARLKQSYPVIQAYFAELSEK